MRWIGCALMLATCALPVAAISPDSSLLTDLAPSHNAISDEAVIDSGDMPPVRDVTGERRRQKMKVLLLSDLDKRSMINYMMRYYHVDRELSGMMTFQLLRSHELDLSRALEEVGEIVNRVRSEITTLRLVRESYKRQDRSQLDLMNYLRRTAADALTTAVRKICGLDSTKYHAVVIKKMVHALQMYAQPELGDPLAEEGTDELWNNREVQRQRDEIERLQRAARQILISLDQVDLN